jgi:hypothetical protein
MYHYVYVPTHYSIWCYEYGAVWENQQTKERYRVIESSIKDMLNSE